MDEWIEFWYVVYYGCVSKVLVVGGIDFVYVFWVLGVFVFDILGFVDDDVVKGVFGVK